MYEASNENITIINEIYVSLLTSVIFIMALGIVMPILIGGQDMNTFMFLSAFMLIFSEGMLLYLIRSMIPADEIWRRSGEKGESEKKIEKTFKTSIFACVGIGVVLFSGKYLISLPFDFLSFELIVTITITPLIIPGIMAYREETNIARKERNFLAFLPSLGSISSMRGGKIMESVYYLSEKDYGVLTKHLQALYRRLRTRIDDDSAWEWFGSDTGSNYIQRASEMFREATYAAANPRNVSRMITENLRKIRDLRVKKLAIVKSSTSLFAGVTFGLAFCIYVSLVIGQHLNQILLSGMAGRPFEGTHIEMGTLLYPISAETFMMSFTIAFFTLVIHSFMMGLTIKTLRGSNMITTLVYFIPFTWVVTVTSILVQYFLTDFLTV